MWLTMLVILLLVVIVGVVAIVALYFLIKTSSSNPASRAPGGASGAEKTPTPPLIPIGRTDSLCPYCGIEQKPRPKAKKKCRDCGGFIYVRKRPIDEQRVLLRDSDLETLEEQKAIAGGYFYDYLVRKAKHDAAQRILTEQLGRPADETEIAIVIYMEEMDEHLQREDYGLYRNAVLGLACALETNGDYLQALKNHLQVYYLDYNGPNNLGGFVDSTDSELRHEYAWRPDLDNIVSPSNAVTSVVKLNMSEAEVKALFISEMTALKARLGTPFAPEEVWPKFSFQLFKWVEEERKAEEDEEEYDDDENTAEP